MWKSDEDFLADLDYMDEICQTVIHNDNVRKQFEERQKGNIEKRNARVARSLLYSESDDDSPQPSDSRFFVDEDYNDPYVGHLHQMNAVRSQIEMVCVSNILFIV